MRICQKQFIQILEQGLILSEGVTLTLPPSAYLGPLAGKLVPSMVPDIGFKLLQGSSIGNLAHYQLCGHIQNINLLQIRNRKINITPVFQHPKVENLPFIFRKLHLCDSKYLNKRYFILYWVKSDDCLSALLRTKNCSAFDSFQKKVLKKKNQSYLNTR